MKLILCGAAGKMGREVISASREFPAEIVCGLELSPCDLPFPVYSHPEEIKEEADVFLDFSSVLNLDKRIAFCRKKKLPLLVAATGETRHEQDLLQAAAKEIPVLLAPNLSPAVIVMKELLRHASERLKEFDIEIVELHSKSKRDSPSGTALTLQKSMQLSRTKEIPIHSLRAGNAPGEHSVIFAGENEMLTISHSARSRSIFAFGALKAAKWLIMQPAGFYRAEDAFLGSE